MTTEPSEERQVEPISPGDVFLQSLFGMMTIRLIVRVSADCAWYVSWFSRTARVYMVSLAQADQLGERIARARDDVGTR